VAARGVFLFAAGGVGTMEKQKKTTTVLTMVGRSPGWGSCMGRVFQRRVWALKGNRRVQGGLARIDDRVKAQLDYVFGPVFKN
jgi:hypothetical protein